MNIDRQAWVGEEMLAEPRPDMFRAQQLQVRGRGRGGDHVEKRRGQGQGRGLSGRVGEERWGGEMWVWAWGQINWGGGALFRGRYLRLW